MKAILEFNLPEDKDQHTLAINGQKYWCVLHEFDQWLGGVAKYGNSEVEKMESLDIVQKCRDTLSEFMNDEGVSFDDVS